MTDATPSVETQPIAAPPDTSWEQQQKNAAFFQSQLTAVQQASLAFNTAATIIITLSVAMMKLSGFVGGGEFLPIILGVVGWGILTFVLTLSYRRSAKRVRAAYEREHKRLFPGTPPYRLESYLLSYKDDDILR